MKKNLLIMMIGMLFIACGDNNMNNVDNNMTRIDDTSKTIETSNDPKESSDGNPVEIKDESYTETIDENSTQTPDENSQETNNDSTENPDENTTDTTPVYTDNTDSNSTDTIEDNATATTDDNSSRSYFLQKTGQKISYSAKDDGATQIGASREYVKNDSVVEDSVKGLIWQDSSDVTTKSYTKSEAYNYCATLTLDSYSDWRLPSLQEMMSLTDYSTTSPALDSVFESTINRYFWVSTVCPVCSDVTFGVSEANGEFARFTNDNKLQARCVRGDKIAEGKYTRDDSNELVSDSQRGLLWQDGDTLAMEQTRDFSEALTYCSELEFGGYSDWRLPNVIEIRSVFDFEATHGSISSTFLHKSGAYWSSTTSAESITKAWSADFTYAKSTLSDKTKKIYTRCVRDLQ